MYKQTCFCSALSATYIPANPSRISSGLAAEEVSLKDRVCSVLTQSEPRILSDWLQWRKRQSIIS
jgi:hypothetical protein